MGTYVLLLFVTVFYISTVSSLDFAVRIFDSSGNDITNNDDYTAWAGDYISCKFDGDVAGPHVYYGWVKHDDGNPMNKQGPNFISFPNEVDVSNRLYISMALGNGNPITYKCIASDVDPYANRDVLTGANIRFRVSVNNQLDVGIFNSSGHDITDHTNYNVYAGDYIYCKYVGEITAGHIYYGWVKHDDGNPRNKDGPNFISLANEDDHSNRLPISMALGNGQPISYKCIASEEDPYENRDVYTGADIRFTVSNPPLVGQLFPEGDYAVKTGWTIDLLCRRLHNDAVVTWVTTDGEMVYLIYHSGSEDELPENYELVGQDSNDFTLRITMAEETAIFHTCTVEYNALTEVSATAMLFKLDLPNPCTADNLGVTNDVGDLVEFGGCQVDVSHNLVEGIIDDITVLTFWQESTDGEKFSDIESSRAFDDVSTHTVLSNLESDGKSFYCGAQIYREQAAIIRAHVDSVCDNDFDPLTVTDETHAFSIYYGSEEPIELLNWQEINKVVDTDLLCQVDAKPSLSPADRVVFHVKLPGDDHFVETESNIVFSSDIIEGSLYKCVFYEESSDTSYESGNIYLIKGYLLTAIYDSSGNQLNSGDVYSFPVGDYMECRTTEPTLSDYPPQYMWQKSIVIDNGYGPQMIQFRNTADEHNRFPIRYGIGLGEEIAYSCIATDHVQTEIPDFVGTLVKFLVEEECPP